MAFSSQLEHSLIHLVKLCSSLDIAGSRLIISHSVIILCQFMHAHAWSSHGSSKFLVSFRFFFFWQLLLACWCLECCLYVLYRWSGDKLEDFFWNRELGGSVILGICELAMLGFHVPAWGCILESPFSHMEHFNLFKFFLKLSNTIKRPVR